MLGKAIGKLMKLILKSDLTNEMVRILEFESQGLSLWLLSILSFLHWLDYVHSVSFGFAYLCILLRFYLGDQIIVYAILHISPFSEGVPVQLGRGLLKVNIILTVIAVRQWRVLIINVNSLLCVVFACRLCYITISLASLFSFFFFFFVLFFLLGNTEMNLLCKLQNYEACWQSFL